MDITTQCLNTELKPTSCTYTTSTCTDDICDLTVSANVQLTKVDGEPSSMRVVFEHDDGEVSTSLPQTLPANVLATTQTTAETFTTLNITKDFRASAAAVFLDENGEEVICSQSAITVNCEDVTPA